MSKVRVIARAVARKGKEDQLKELLQGMLAPTHHLHPQSRTKNDDEDSDIALNR
jgi:hypothetical protein